MNSYSIINPIVHGVLAAFGSGGQDQRTGKIVASGVYHGAFIADEPSTWDIKKYEWATNEKLDFIILFHAFAKGPEFPKKVCETLYSNHKIAPFIKWEPWSWSGSGDSSFDIGLIAAGVFDGEIARFAEGAAKWGKPLFIAFGHEMNAKHYPWGNRPKEYIAAFRRIADIFRKKGATNVTWVWNIDARSDFKSYYPGNDVVDFIAIDGYSTDWTDNPDKAAKLFDRQITTLKKLYPGKPVIIGETAYDRRNGGTKAGRESFVSSLVDYSALKLSGFAWFNRNKTEAGSLREWSLGRSAGTLGRAIDNHQNLFDTSITTKAR